ncbi:hypothetical protein B0H19DRAFT_1229476 [Mycena capillaripes]|nr:hypothetical protein B0H19DRAFT_1229476 [Mycena capillaripes]
MSSDLIFWIRQIFNKISFQPNSPGEIVAEILIKFPEWNLLRGIPRERFASPNKRGGRGRKEGSGVGIQSGAAIDLRGIRRDESPEWNSSQVTPRERSAAKGPAQRLGRVEVIAGGSLRGTSLRMVRCAESGAAIPPNGIHGWDVVANDPLWKVLRRDLVARNRTSLGGGFFFVEGDSAQTDLDRGGSLVTQAGGAMRDAGGCKGGECAAGWEDERSDIHRVGARGRRRWRGGVLGLGRRGRADGDAKVVV